jgi:hypothetical protein
MRVVNSTGVLTGHLLQNLFDTGEATSDDVAWVNYTSSFVKCVQHNLFPVKCDLQKVFFMKCDKISVHPPQ